MTGRRRPRLALTQGDPAGIGPEILLKLLTPAAAPGEGAASGEPLWEPLIIAERAALEVLRPVLPQAEDIPWERFRYLGGLPSAEELDAIGRDGGIPVVDPVGTSRPLTFGDSGPADAFGAMAALDAGIGLVRSGVADALVTAPVSKSSIARQHLPGFKGHTDYLRSEERFSRNDAT